MSNFFEDNLKMFFNESMEGSFKKLYECDENYQNIRSAHTKASQRYYDIMESLSEKDMKFAENFKCDELLIECIEREWIYLQGYKDCIKFLKFIEAI